MSPGRFISVDPIMDLTNPQQWHTYTYTYTYASPVTNSDPSGFLLKWADETGGGSVLAPIEILAIDDDNQYVVTYEVSPVLYG